jgi:hypothetical protein
MNTDKNREFLKLTQIRNWRFLINSIALHSYSFAVIHSNSILKTHLTIYIM